MNLLDGMKKKSTIENSKGSKYYATTYNSNLDVFTMLSRYNSSDDIIRKFNNAIDEDENLALANLLYILDIRNGKGERLLFKTIYKYLCLNHSDLALKILPFIKELGRFDYILLGIDTPIEKMTIDVIKKQLDDDINSDSPSLLAKWLPSHRNHNEDNVLAKKIRKKLGMDEKEYRKMLSSLRGKINIVEKNLTDRNYDNIDFEKVPTKAMLKYANAYKKRMPNKYQEYKDGVKNGSLKINTNGLFVYEIIQKILYNKLNNDEELYDLMWKNQKDILSGVDANVLVMADTSGSMTCCGGIPYATSIGLALYTAERNNGIFKNHFITFSSEPYLCEVKGNTISEKVKNIPCFIESTDIDKAFKLVLDTAVSNKIDQKELPSHLLIISDMEFDDGVYTQDGTNFDGWKKAYQEAGYKLPIIIFWNVAASTRGIPTTKFDKDVCMVSGFATNILENLLTLDNYSPIDVMIEKLSVYLGMLEENN